MGLAYHYSALASPSLWIGAVAGVAMIAGAIWFRRWRDDS
jgi:ABC-2 type transport system permease protein